MRRTDIAFWAATSVSLAVFALLGPLERRIELIGEDDLSRIWAGPRAFLTGTDPYDPSGWYAAAVALGTQAPDTAVYIYPPWVTLVLLPLGALPLLLASFLWLGASLALAIFALRAALTTLLPGRWPEHALLAATLVLTWSGVVNLTIGQWGHILVAAIFATVLLLRRGRYAVAGLAAVALVVKPHLFLLTAPALAVQALWPTEGRVPARAGVRFVAVALGVAVALVAAAWIVFPSWWPSWLQGVVGQQVQLTRNTVAGFLGVVFGPSGTPFAPLVILALVALALRFHPRSPGWLPVWTALSIVVVPYASSYDHILLIVPVVLAAGALLPMSPRASRLVAIAGAAVLLLLTPVVYAIAVLRHGESHSVVVPLAVFAIVTVGLWRFRTPPATLPAP